MALSSATIGFIAVAPLFATPEHIVIWNGGEDNIPVYTIPGFTVTKSGVIIAYAEARHEGRGDGCG